MKKHNVFEQSKNTTSEIILIAEQFTLTKEGYTLFASYMKMVVHGAWAHAIQRGIKLILAPMSMRALPTTTSLIEHNIVTTPRSLCLGGRMR